MEQEKLEQDIEDLELHDKSEEEIIHVIEALSKDGMILRRRRKKVRYQLYRLHNEALGITSNVSEEGFKEQFESDPNFGGWRFFTITWDVAIDDPYRCVHKDKSAEDEWNEIVAAKFPQMTSDGKLSYPDITVRKAVEKEAKLQAKKSGK